MVEDLGWQVSEATGPTHGRTSNHIRGLAISVKVYSILRAKCSSICLSVTPFLHIVCSMYYVLFLLFSLSPPYSLLTTSHPLLPLPSSPPYSLLTTSHPLLPLSPLFSSLSHYFPPPSSLSPPLPIPFSLPPPPYSLLTTSHPLLPPTHKPSGSPCLPKATKCFIWKVEHIAKQMMAKTRAQMMP